MTPTFLLLLLSMTTVCLSDTGDQTDESMDVSEIIARANADIGSQVVHGDIVRDLRRNADSCTAKGCKWRKMLWRKYTYVPVRISSAYSRAERNIIIRGLVTFHKSTCIRFVWKRWWHRSYIYFFSGSGCWSYLGRVGGRQRISLKKRGCLYQSTVQHEVLHALGFHHEHVRSDRDTYVQILTQNIQPGRESNFQKENTNNLNTPYDFMSVMQYSKYAFSRNGLPTIINKSDTNAAFGTATQMSPNDIARVNRLYKC
ncbi:hatching enzyme 1.2-like [Mugil cephalus]|uniref:hatching enzyme 1.2-like n=1 Tax=Mugil cephalus TaxID=48193 RepID=UPI001FB747B7|nr:hatching enzyme 1.2-like [Mugil cephalus]